MSYGQELPVRIRAAVAGRGNGGEGHLITSSFVATRALLSKVSLVGWCREDILSAVAP